VTTIGQKQQSPTGCSGVVDPFELLAGAPWLTRLAKLGHHPAEIDGSATPGRHRSLGPREQSQTSSLPSAKRLKSVCRFPSSQPPCPGTQKRRRA